MVNRLCLREGEWATKSFVLEGWAVLLKIISYRGGLIGCV